MNFTEACFHIINMQLEDLTDSTRPDDLKSIAASMNTVVMKERYGAIACRFWSAH